jgi:hypothetical protein
MFEIVLIKKTMKNVEKIPESTNTKKNTTFKKKSKS